MFHLAPNWSVAVDVIGKIICARRDGGDVWARHTSSNENMRACGVATSLKVSARPSVRAKRARAVLARAENEQMNQEMSGGEIGLGGLEDMMDKADGGAAPDFVKELGIKELDDVFAILGSKTKGAELGQLVLTEKFGETLYRESGFTATAEMINGRCAVGLIDDAREDYLYPSRESI